jgi:putative polyhydroxyalkanoate system protein
MADIKVERAHDLGIKGAKSAADQMVDKLDRQFGLTCRWEGHTLHFDRPGVAGMMVITEIDMVIEVRLGFLLKAMKGPIERAVHEQIDQVLTSETPAKTQAKATAKKAPGGRNKSV